MEVSKLTPSKMFKKTVRYDVPEFQRRYVWGLERQWEPLWEDVREKAELLLEGKGNTPHFLGAVVLQQVATRSDEFEARLVVDGQQRLTTLQLLLDAVQEVFAARGIEKPARRLSRLVLNDEDDLDGDLSKVFKVWPTRNDQEAFRHAMDNGLGTEGHGDSRIVRAHEFFREQVGSWLDASVEIGVRELEAAEAMERAVSHRLELVAIDLTDQDEPHTIFETLNARGTPLLQSEMIKNRIMYEIQRNSDAEPVTDLWPFEASDETSEWWSREIGRGRQRRARIDIFLNNWLSMRRGRAVKANEEFSEFVKYAQRNGSITDVAADLGAISETYRHLEDRLGPDSETFLYRRETMQVGVLTPVLLWLAASTPPHDQLRKALRSLESYLVRRMVCRLNARQYGVLFMELLRDVIEVGAEHAGDKIVGRLMSEQSGASVWPSDDDLREAFRREPLYWSLSRGRLRMVLEGIEGTLRTSKSEARSVPRNLTIEHIMPQGWMRHWPLPADTEEPVTAARHRERMIHTIGNLTLANDKLNPALSNGPWERKRVLLEDHSVLFLNKRVLDDAPQVWDEHAIEERSQKLCEAAIRVWPHAGSI